MISYNMSCDCGHMPLHYPKKKRKIKLRKLDKKKRKSKSNIKVQVYHDNNTLK